MKPVMDQDFFNFETMKNKSTAAGYMTLWLVNLVRFNTIYKKVKPLMDQSEAAQAMADAKSKDLEAV
jgi:dynein heavy chain